VIVGALSHPENIYDGHTLDEVMEMVSVVLNQPPSHLIVDRGYRGRKQVEEAEVCVPNRSNQKQTKHHKAQARKRFRRRAAIEPVIGHLKHDFRMARIYLKGKLGDQINVMMAACAWNIKKWMRKSLFAWVRGEISYFQQTIKCFSKLNLSLYDRLSKI
jgi:IS5 family transposase